MIKTNQMWGLTSTISHKSSPYAVASLIVMDTEMRRTLGYDMKE